MNSVKISLWQLLVTVLIVGLCTSLFVTQNQLRVAHKRVDESSAKLRRQLETNAYSINTQLLAQTSNFAVYSIKVDSVFEHSIEFELKDNPKPRISALSFLEPGDNLWSSDLLLTVLRHDDKSCFYVSGCAADPEHFVRMLCEVKGAIPKLVGFGESGDLSDEIEIELGIVEGIDDLPFQLTLRRRQISHDVRDPVNDRAIESSSE